MTSPEPERLARAIRAGADGLSALEAACELLISTGWLHRDDFTRLIRTEIPCPAGTEVAEIDWQAVITSRDAGQLPCSGGENRILRLAASIATGIPVDLNHALSGLDHASITLVTRAVRHANGTRPDEYQAGDQVSCRDSSRRCPSHDTCPGLARSRIPLRRWPASPRGPQAPRRERSQALRTDMNNSDLPIRLGILIATHTATWVEESQPIQWRPDAWRRYWHENGLPCGHVLDELEAEHRSQGTIRRKFILDTYQDRPATELFIATMAWGSGPDNRGPARAGGILTQPQASDKIEDTISVVRQGGAAAGYRAYYARNKIENLDVAFITKLLYFAGYRSPHRPRPLIYDSLVATTAARLPGAPLFPLIADGVTTSSYQRYCTWAADIAEEYQTEPVVIEWSFFALGADIRDELRQ